MFRVLSAQLFRYPWVSIGVWIGLAAFVGLLAPSRAAVQQSEPATLLPADSALNRSMRLYADAFPSLHARSNVVLVFHRGSGLTDFDHRFIKEVVLRLEQHGQQRSQPWGVLSAATDPALSPRLNSADGEAAMVVVNLDVNFITQRAAEAVNEVESLAENSLPQELALEITGSAGIGREHNRRAQAALERTTVVTITAVLIILALVYRSPLGALVPLVSIGMSVFIAFRVLDFLALGGWAISEIERTFTVVLLYGAGTDYALFWISRYREGLSAGHSRAQSAANAMTVVGPAILASAGTTILGLMMLMWANMVVIHMAGRVLGIVLVISLLAAVTLTPAMAFVMGSAFFWPGTPKDKFSIGQRFVWPKVANDVVRHPAIVFTCGLIVIGIPAYAALSVPLRYDSFGEVAKGSSAERGLKLVKAHFSEQELFSTRLLVQSDRFEGDPARARGLSGKLASRILQVDGVTDVWHLGAPLGRQQERELASRVTSTLLPEQVVGLYFARNKNILQLEVMQRYPPLSSKAVGVYQEVRRMVSSWAAEALGKGSEIYAIGQTPYIVDVMKVADGDLGRVIPLAIVVIWFIVLLLVRCFWLSVFMLIATLITFGAALGLTGWVFVDWLGRSGVDYKLRILLFVVIVAVGQDYNIFLVTRMFEEIKMYGLAEGMTRSIILTGPVISSCGLIMAATLGSLATTGVDLTEQLGFAFAAGILIDTFLVRPLLIPSFYLLLERLRGSKQRWGRGSSSRTAPDSTDR